MNSEQTSMIESMKISFANRKIALSFLAFLSTSCIILVLLQYSKNYYVRKLPNNASEILEDTIIFTDYNYKLRAKISEDDYYVYVKILGLKKGIDESISWQKSSSITWWDPTRSNANTYYSKMKKRDTVAYITTKYENGYLYLNVYEF